jgi:hypothetical protein
LRHQILFLGLDSALGELGTGWWIGGIDIGEIEGESLPLSDLAARVDDIRTERGWKKLGPGEGRTLYKLEDQGDAFPRADVVMGQTAHVRLLEEHLESEGSMDDPLASLGADFAYVSFDSSTLPKGGEVAARSAIEDALEGALRPGKLGRVLGGALGSRRSYVDLLLLDGPRSVAAVVDTIRAAGIKGAPELEYFDRSSRDRGVAI